MTGSAPRSTDTMAARNPVQVVGLAVGIVFLLVGVLGFVPGITTDYDQLTFAGHHSEAKLLGLFMVSVLHNLVHLAFGIVGIATSRSSTGSRNFLIGGGVVYLVLWVYGLLVDQTSAANFVPMNNADNWLHLGLGVGMVVLGVLAARASTAVKPTASEHG